MKKSIRQISLQPVALPDEPGVYRFALTEGKQEVMHSFFKSNRKAVWQAVAILQGRFECDATIKHQPYTPSESAIIGVLASLYDSFDMFFACVVEA